MSDPTLLILPASAFFTSLLSGVLGRGGGVLLIGIMSAYLSPAVLIPMHGIVQLGSNVSRAALSLDHVRWEITRIFALGALAGAALGSQVVIVLPEKTFSLVLGAFVLAMTWAPPIPAVGQFRGKFFWVGALNSFLSLIVGATGIIQGPFFVREGMSKESTIATEATCQTVVHSLKVAVYLWLGFALGAHLPLMGAMLVTSFAGSYASKRLLKNMPDRVFKVLFKGTVTVLAIRLLTKGLAA